MANVTCYGYSCTAGSKWESSLKSCCEPSGRSVSAYGQYACAGDGLKPTFECFNQTYNATKSQFDIYPIYCSDMVGKRVDVGYVGDHNQSAFMCSRYFLAACYDLNGNSTQDPRHGRQCQTPPPPPRRPSEASSRVHRTWAAMAFMTLIVSSFVLAA